ncbi:hypothetical protein DPMN_069878 [Dreissena polymorpha]|uniref:Uncharacterized protein n=1 Tax=Dreissena polymorpha TaxID=45954 RepID=A0A9D3Z562_DREPO|nr:hypothetical protein DPMN_069878 [Dreissena polymorpha]
MMFFVNIRDFGALTNSQVDQVVELWEAMSEYDKRPTVFPERFPSHLKGMFRATKRKVAPGIEAIHKLETNNYVKGIGIIHLNN